MNQERKSLAGNAVLFFVITVALLAGSVYFLMDWDKYLKKGLDLEGGVYVLLEATDVSGDEGNDAIQRAMTVIRKRIDELGVAEPVIRREGDRRIRIELPGIEDQAQAMKLIGTTAMLEFRAPDMETVLLTGEHLKTAYFTRGEMNEPLVGLEFNSEGKELFAKATADHLGEIIYIFLDDDLVSYPVVQSVITGGNAVITGNRTAEEASEIALLLRTGALPVNLIELETRVVGPSLGENALRLSLTAGAIGFIAIAIFMLIFYRFAGFISVVSLTVYVALVLLMLSLMGVTVTLPGIAGLILSIAMAIDANILIFERSKEELASGRTIFTAINAGFERAFTAIIDANLTTIIVALVLIFVASGPLRGFAVVLFIGLLLSLFSACVLSRFLLRMAARSQLIKNPGYIGAGLKGVTQDGKN